MEPRRRDSATSKSAPRIKAISRLRFARIERRVTLWKRKPGAGTTTFHRIEQSVTFFEVGGMVLKPKSPTLAKTALGWGILKLRYPAAQPWDTAESLLRHREPPVDSKGFSKVSQGKRETQNGPLPNGIDFNAPFPLRYGNGNGFSPYSDFYSTCCFAL
jgi:hypothetical protein